MDKVFQDNPNLKAYFATSDGQAFYTENSAANHARSLKDKSVSCHQRPATNSDAPLFEQLSEMTVPELKAYAQAKKLTVTKSRKSEVLEEITNQLAEEENLSTTGEQTDPTPQN